MTGTQGTIVTGIHRLQHIQSLAASNLSDDDPLRSHTQRRLDQIPNRHGTVSGRIGIAGFQTYQVINSFNL